ncbi:putative butyrate kinase [Geomonas sp. Red276]
MNILAIDPGSTSTKIGIYRRGELEKGCIRHPHAEIDRFPRVMDQLDYRLASLERYLAERGDAATFDLVVGRGGLVRPVPGGTYLVDDLLEADLVRGVSGEHACNLGGVLARRVADRHGVAACIVDPPVIDELWPPARFSGLRGVERTSMFHALNQRACALRAARELGRDYRELNLIVAHLGSGITVGAHRQGRVVDVNNGLNGDGPFSPERTGGLPLTGVLRLLEEGSCSIDELKVTIARRGGVFSYLGTVELTEVEERIARGEREAAQVFEALVYQVAKEIGALAAALDGEVDAVLLTGGLAFSPALTGALAAKVSFVGPVLVRPGEYELEALVEAGVRVLTGVDKPKSYGGSHEDRP